MPWTCSGSFGRCPLLTDILVHVCVVVVVAGGWLMVTGWSDVPGERTWNQENFKAWCTTTPDNERLQRIHDFVDAPPG